MAKALINKHVDNASELYKNIFLQDLEKAKGEIIICNDNNDPSIYITNNDGVITKVTGGGSSDNDNRLDDIIYEIESLKVEDSKIRKEINNYIGDIESGKTVVSLINDVKSNVDEYTINNKKIATSPVIDTSDLKINDNYEAVKHSYDFVLPGDVLTTAISKIEVMLANTTLALTAAINDLESRIGIASEKDENGNIIKNATGIMAKIEEIDNKLKEK
jgi:hypothetical protein